VTDSASKINRRPLVSVIIPYYQRKHGVLAKCVKSILAQEGPFDLRVVITDDSSPVPAEEDLSKESCLDPRVHIVRQANAGAGAARNKCLDNVCPESDYIALMDSDDEWMESFLACAIQALEKGYDLFFSDSKRYSEEASRFNWENDPRLNLQPKDHLLIDADSNLYEYQGNFFDYAVRRSNIMGPSAMVYRRSIAPDLRFSDKLRNGQDRLFKLHLCCAVNKVAFSTRILSTEGEGVNIFDSASWGTRDSLLRASSYIDLAKAICGEVPLSAQQRLYVESQLGAARKEFVGGVIHLLRRRKPFDWKLVFRTLRRDPRSMLELFNISGKFVFGAR